MRAGIFLLLFLFVTSKADGQLKNGFDKDEYIELLKVFGGTYKTSPVKKNIPPPVRSKLLYRSPVVGMDNRWDLWMRNDKVAIISVRGTTAQSISWIENLYAAMVPAIGTLHLNDTTIFSYHLADNPQAGVHVGWLIGMASMSADVVSKIDSCYHTGIKDFIIAGHSQGGAISFLMRSYLEDLKKQKLLPADIHFKTYCSAAPKPGNIYYAYEYEAMTQDGSSFTVLNSVDWVPEVPVSVQTIEDFNIINPITDAGHVIRKQRFPLNFALRYIYGQLSKPSLKAQRRNNKYLGRIIAKKVAKHISGYKPPEYIKSSAFVRTGNCVILLADEDYHRHFPDDKNNVFCHHMFKPYLYLAEKLSL